ncbi:unnamed protein product [Ectocarpus sp. 12 AP-2014]
MSFLVQELTSQSTASGVHYVASAGKTHLRRCSGGLGSNVSARHLIGGQRRPLTQCLHSTTHRREPSVCVSMETEYSRMESNRTWVSCSTGSTKTVREMFRQGDILACQPRNS